MNSKTWRRALFLLLSLLALIATTTAVSAAQSLPEAVRTSLTVPDPQIEVDPSGFDVFEIEGYHTIGLPGDPLLPAHALNIALPPDVIPSTVQVSVIDQYKEDLPGVFDIEPAPPYEAWTDGGKVVHWGANAATIVDGKNTAVYGQNTFFPPQSVELSAFSQMRKWRFARVQVKPVSYNPVSGQVQVTKEIDFEVQFSRKADRGISAAQIRLEMSDTLLDGHAIEMFANTAQAKKWYTQDGPDNWIMSSVAETRPGYVIVTTNQIVNRSGKLDDFVAHKENRGFNVRVITENEYGGLSGQPPHGTAEKVREWLKSNYLDLNLVYVLLIGNPDPDQAHVNDSVGDLPMKIVYPSDLAGELDFTVPTDYFYADLSGNWDLNSDQIYGDVPDRHPGGVDLTPEVYVGRIPVYNNSGGWPAALDSILQKTIDFETSSDTSWRRSALLPMAFMDSNQDEAPMAELMKAGYLDELEFATYTMYEQGARGSGFDSMYESDEALVWPSVRTHWQDNPYGLVVWSTHGNETGAVHVINSWEAQYLNDSRPGMTFQLSCSTGLPEHSENLGYSLLKNGAVATVSASRVSWGFFTPPNPINGSNTDHAYFYTERLARNWPAGRALYTTKSQFADFWWLANRMAYNLYGDPALSLQNPSITICKQSEPANGTPFDFSGDLGTFTLSDPYTPCRTFASLTPGTYQVQEDVPGDWHLEDWEWRSGCYDTLAGGHSSWDFGDGRLTIDLAAGSAMQCTFVNRHDPFEPNDTATQADTSSAIEFGTTIQAAIGSHGVVPFYDDIDYFGFSGVAGDRVELNLDTHGTNLAPWLVLEDAHGEIIASGEPGWNETRLDYRLEDSGDYYLVVMGMCSEGGSGCDGRYSLHLGDAHEANDSEESATLLNMNDEVRGAIDYHDDVPFWSDFDFYRFEGISGDTIDIEITSLTANLYPLCELLDSASSTLASAEGNTCHIEQVLPASGDYFIKVFASCSEGGSGCQGPYTLSLRSLNNQPACEKDEFEVYAAETLTVAAPGALANDDDPDGDELTAVLATDTQHGDLDLLADGSFTYTPDTGYTGPDSFQYQAFDGIAKSEPATVNLTIRPRMIFLPFSSGV